MTDTQSPPSTARIFADLGVNQEICDALTDLGITHPFPIQELTLPLALSGADLIGQARTGTGKTLAFGIPLLQRVDLSKRATQALVIVPTRELGAQVAQDLEQAGARLGVRVVPVYGGKAIEPQAKAIAEGAPVVVGTPGRLLDLVGRGTLKLGTVQSLVLDEADEMLDLGFLPDVEQLIEATASDRQTLLFSATMPSAVVALARRYMHKPTFLRADVEEIRIAPETQQHFFSCHRMDKPAVLARILQTPERGLCVVFTRTKRMADVLVEDLAERGVKAAPIHSDLRQEARERALERFRSGTIDVLCATEVAARGLDIDDVTHVVNYDCPDDEKMYLHRIGRTGRAGAAGVAITLAVWNELARLEMIKKALDIEEPTHEVFSTSPVLDELFALPPRPERPASKARSQAGSQARGKTGSQAGGQVRSKTGSKRNPIRSESRSEDEAPEAGSQRRSGSKAGPKTEAPAEGRAGAKAGSGTRADAGVPREVAAEPDASREEDTTSGRRRVRRRTRLDTPAVEPPTQSEARAPRQTASTEPSTAAPSEESGEPSQRRTRARDQRRRDESGRRSERPTRSGDDRASREGRSRRGGRSEGAERGDSGGRSESAERSDSAERQGRDRTGRDRSGRERDEGRDRRSSPRSRVDAGTARGDGKPALNRPLRIDHLP